MTDRAAPTARPAARRPALAHTVLRVAAVAATATALVWSALFFGAARKHTAAAATPPTAQITPADQGTQAPAPAPVTTRTS